MPLLELDRIQDVARERDAIGVETSFEDFDRHAFAQEALDIIRPQRTRIAICEGSSRVRVESGRSWGSGHPEDRWAIVSIPRKASRRAIALAVSELTGVPAPYVLDVLLARATAT